MLFRVSAQSRVIEDALRQSGLPYRVYGGLRFYERAEIKDALAYVRLVNIRSDDAAFERIINTPPRGIGQRSLEAIRTVAKTERVSLWEAGLRLIETKELAARAINSLFHYTELIDRLSVS